MERAAFVLEGASSTSLGNVVADTVILIETSLLDATTFSIPFSQRLAFIEAGELMGEFEGLENGAFVSLGGSEAQIQYQHQSSPNRFSLIGFGQADFGDAPAPYPTTQAMDGAAHGNAGPFLGLLRDIESDADIGATVNFLLDDESGDSVSIRVGDGSDEDGVSVTGALVAGDIAMRGGLVVTSSSQGSLDAWIDFNQDGDWSDADEQIFESKALAAGSNRMLFTIPASALVGNAWARFRLSSTGGLAPTGSAVDGEVEDYLFTFVSAVEAHEWSIDASGEPVVTLENGQIVTRVQGVVVSSIALETVGTLVVAGNAANNTITIDPATIPSGGAVYHDDENTDFDVLKLVDSIGDIRSVSYTFADAGGGQVEIDGRTLLHTGLEAIIDSTAATSRSFEFPGGDNDVTLSDITSGAGNAFRIATAPDSGFVDFTNASNDLRIDLASGNNRLQFASPMKDLATAISVVSADGDDLLAAVTGDIVASNLSVTKSGGTLQVSNKLIAESFATTGDFSLAMPAGAELSGTATFENTLGVSLGDSPSDTFDFDGGVTNVASLTTMQGTIHTTQQMEFGDVALAGSANLTGATISVERIRGTSNLTLAGDVILRGAGIVTTGSLSLTGSLTLATDSTLAFSGELNISQPIAGDFSLRKAGDGSLTIHPSFASTLIAESGTVNLVGLAGQLLLDGGIARFTSVVHGIDSTGNGGLLQLLTETTAASVDGNAKFDGATTLQLTLDAPAGVTDSLNIVGLSRTVDLGDATLAVSVGYPVPNGDSLTIVNLEDSSSVLSGQFAGLADGTLLTIGNQTFVIRYSAGDGNDVVLTKVATAELDFGDASATYGTVLAENGARHLATGPMLGSTRDAELDVAPNDLADVDDSTGESDSDDEDGVNFEILTAGGATLLTVSVSRCEQRCSVQFVD